MDRDIQPLSHNYTGTALYAANKLFQWKCNDLSDEFIICKRDKGENPALCLKENKKLFACAKDTLRSIDTNGCSASFGQYFKCLDRESFTLDDCRKQQHAFESCMKIPIDKM